MGEEGPAVHVPDRVQPRAPGYPEGFVHLEVAPRLEPHGFESELFGPWTTPDRDEHLVTLDAPAVPELQHELGARAPDPRDFRASSHIDAELDKGMFELIADERLLADKQPVGPFEEGDLRPERVPGLRHLDADDPAPEDEQPPGDLARGRYLAVRPRLDLGEPWEGRKGGARPDGHYDGLAGLEQLPVGAHATLSFEASVAANQFDASRGDPVHLPLVVEAVHDAISALEHRGDVRAAAYRLAGTRDAPGLM